MGGCTLKGMDRLGVVAVAILVGLILSVVFVLVFGEDY
jgi:hypothetical protein